MSQLVGCLTWTEECVGSSPAILTKMANAFYVV